MDIGKPKIPTEAFFGRDLDLAVTQYAIAFDVIAKELVLTPGTARIPVSASVAIGNAIAIVNGLARPASAAANIPAIGVCVRSAASAGQVASIILGMGYASGLSGLTPNTSYYLGNAGALVASIPGAGMKQSIGYALSATELFVTISQPFA